MSKEELMRPVAMDGFIMLVKVHSRVRAVAEGIAYLTMSSVVEKNSKTQDQAAGHESPIMTKARQL